MLICHCQGISDRDIRATVAWMRAADPDTVVTPGKIYHALGRRADCGGCMSLFVSTMRTAPGFAVPAGDALPAGGVPAILRHMRANAAGERNEGRPEGHRLSEQRAAV
ncbi:(2Fe-2S)-binding protein [Paracoccus sp. S-4012]|uniref:(2Fe-2S)-binding protein n=1 Tax=Paracoccus sp. S-4012 TaxID=2665648 RepID=UPI0012B0FC39|nr:(2Fe-2S)-binding protein [Paracoccus sp. S-4012]MRX50014.1 (2Fe-2S)-binding protein [Paracoccus sp. S-4012]